MYIVPASLGRQPSKISHFSWIFDRYFLKIARLNYTELTYLLPPRFRGGVRWTPKFQDIFHEKKSVKSNESQGIFQTPVFTQFIECTNTLRFQKCIPCQIIENWAMPSYIRSCSVVCRICYLPHLGWTVFPMFLHFISIHFAVESLIVWHLWAHFGLLFLFPGDFISSPRYLSPAKISSTSMTWQDLWGHRLT